MPKILVADDDAAIRMLYTVNLRAEGYNVVEAHDELAAVEVARAERPAIGLLDVWMPGLNGWQVAQALLEAPETSEIAIVFVPAGAIDRKQAAELDSAQIPYLPKPWDVISLGSELKRLTASYDRSTEAKAKRLNVVRDLARHG